MADLIAADHLRSFIERIERLEEEKASLASDIREVYVEAKGNGFDTKTIRKIVGMRKQDFAKRQEEAAVLELYMDALGMLAETPLGRSAVDRDFGNTKMSIEVPGSGMAPVHFTGNDLKRVSAGLELEAKAGSKRRKSLSDKIGDAIEKAVEGTGATVLRNASLADLQTPVEPAGQGEDTAGDGSNVSRASPDPAEWPELPDCLRRDPPNRDVNVFG
jgi:uncharacterized protein (UPF0335 family)